MQDIWGVTDPLTGQSKILAIASNKFTADGKAVLQIDGNKAIQLQTNGLPFSIEGIWSAAGKMWYICGDGFYRTRFLNKPWQAITETPKIYQECIRGNAFNDIFTIGHLGLVLHWNGADWHDFSHAPGIYNGLAVEGDLVVSVGINPEGVLTCAKILMGKRN